MSQTSCFYLRDFDDQSQVFRFACELVGLNGESSADAGDGGGGELAAQRLAEAHSAGAIKGAFVRDVLTNQPAVAGL